MRAHFLRAFFVLTAICAHHRGLPQYTVSVSEAWSATGAPNFCNNCTFTIAAGATLTLDVNNVTCANCLFSGGTVVDNAKFSWQGGTFSFDSVAFKNASSSLQVSGVGGTLFNNSKVEFTQAITCQACTFNGDQVHLDLPAATSKVTFQSSGGFTTTTINNSTVTVNTGEWYANSTTTATNSTLYFNNSSSIDNNTGTFTLSGSKLYLNDNSYVTTSAGFVIENTGWVTVGNGPLSSGAYFFDNSGTKPVIKDNSGIGIANQNNYYSNWGQYTYTPTSGGSTNFTTTNLGFNCGASYAHSTAYCNSNAEYVFGCATLNGSGPLACVTLAVSGITLNTQLTADGVRLSWNDAQNSAAVSYLVERSTGKGDWTGIATVDADGLSSGDYEFVDRTATSGTSMPGSGAPATVSYRIARSDREGNIRYSEVATVEVSRDLHIAGVFPNPVTGRTFYLATRNSSQVLVNVYTLTGQLVLRTALQGQIRYAVQLPAQLLPGTSVIVQTTLPDQVTSYPLLLR